MTEIMAAIGILHKTLTKNAHNMNREISKIT